MTAEGALHPLLLQLTAEGVVRCSVCTGPLQGDAELLAFTCGSCSASFATHTRVLDLVRLGQRADVPDAEVRRTVALARPIVGALDLPGDDTVVAHVEDVLQRAVRLSSDEAALDAEIRDVADRYGLTLGDVQVEPAPGGAGPSSGVDDVVVDLRTPPAPAPDPVAPVLSVVRQYVPASLPAGQRRTCNVRFRNDGAEEVSSLSDPPLTIGSRWFRAGDLGAVPVPESRARIPVRIEPGRAITVPVVLDPPPTPGRYVLVVCPVLEGRRWLPECGTAIELEVTPATAPLRLVADASAPVRGYAEDHEHARALLGEVAAELLARPGRRLLEIGGGGGPQIPWFGPHDAVCVDINLPVLELGSLWYRHNADDAVSERLAFLCADATRLPFADRSFDVVAMFATLHHFGEPEGLLAECRRVLADDGVVAVLCEPVGATLESDAVLRDLDKGVNEQVFTLDEYEAIFAAAGLELVRGVEEAGSLKAFLRRGPEPPAAPFAAAPVPVAVLADRAFGGTVDRDGTRPNPARRLARALAHRLRR